MKYKNHIKRVADILEKLGLAGIAVWLFQQPFHPEGVPFWLFGLSSVLLVLSFFLTMEDA